MVSVSPRLHRIQLYRCGKGYNLWIILRFDALGGFFSAISAKLTNGFNLPPGSEPSVLRVIREIRAYSSCPSITQEHLSIGLQMYLRVYYYPLRGAIDSPFSLSPKNCQKWVCWLPGSHRRAF